MNQRCLPRSFFHQHHLNNVETTTSAASMAAAAAVTSTSVSTSHYADFYSDPLQQAAVLNQLSPEWQYLSAHAAQPGYRFAAAAQHYNAHSRLHQTASTAAAAPGSYWRAGLAGQVKGEWAGDYQATASALTSAGLHNAASDFTHHYGSAAAVAHHYSNMTGKS